MGRAMALSSGLRQAAPMAVAQTPIVTVLFRAQTEQVPGHQYPSSGAIREVSLAAAAMWICRPRTERAQQKVTTHMQARRPITIAAKHAIWERVRTRPDMPTIT